MGIFSFNFKENFSTIFFDEKDSDYALVCTEFQKMVSKYIISQEIHSEKFWNYLKNNFGIGEKDILQKTELSLDEKSKQYKHYKYYVKCEFNRTKIYFVFFDEFRNLSDEDYHKYVPDSDKSDKISKMVIYYDSDMISTKTIEDSIVSDILLFAHTPSTKNQFFTITNTSYGGYELNSSYIKEMDIDLEMNYGEKFLKIYDKMVDNLRNRKNGLFLLHGDPGTGKTTLIRKLISELSEEKLIIYVPTYMMHSIADPELISFVGGFRNAILLLEDSEHILSSRSDNRTQAISNILNMTDGLLNDFMEVQIISTFNTDAKIIDPALKRAGRLIVNYRFNKLKPEQANKLAKKIGSDSIFTEPVTLSEIYEGANQIIEDDDLSRKSIGF